MIRIELRQIKKLSLNELEPILTESLEYGFNFIQRLLDDYLQKVNRFDQAGEILLGLFWDQTMIGIGGLNKDPYLPELNAGRIRHVYVLYQYRRKGYGKTLVTRLVNHAAAYFDLVTLRTKTAAGAQFYESLVFQPTGALPQATHVYHFITKYA